MRTFTSVLLFSAGSLSALVAGCSDYGIEEQRDPNQVTPSLEADPPVLDFGGVPYDESSDLVLVLRNVGNAGLTVEGLNVTSGAAFTIGAIELPLYLGPGEEGEMLVSYGPLNTDDEGLLTIDSTDPVSPTFGVPLDGEGLFPALDVEPPWVDMGSVGRCHEEAETLVLTNVGDSDLVITELSQVGEGWSVGDAPDIPMSLAPDETAVVEVVFTPSEDGSVSGSLWIRSNDPAELTEVEELAYGDGWATDERFEKWRQPEGPHDGVDLLFFVDQSSSMDDNRTNLQSNFPVLSEALDASGVTWQAMVATDDDGCANGGMLIGGTAGVEDAFADAVIGPWGWYSESGLAVAAAGVGQADGGCNDGFFREDALPMLVMVSDEADQSPGGWETQLSSIQASLPSVVVISIIGDMPEGCDSASPGSGYYEAAMATEGDVHSICDEDWSDYFEDIATLVTDAPTDTFVLEDPAAPDSLVVRVDSVETEAWTFDEDANAVILDEMPESGAWIEVDYWLDSGCEE